jgi:hypothetical protein
MLGTVTPAPADARLNLDNECYKNLGCGSSVNTGTDLGFIPGREVGNSTVHHIVQSCTILYLLTWLKESKLSHEKLYYT